MQFFFYFCYMHCRKSVFSFLIAIVAATASYAQGSNNVWSLQQCVQYAIDHNITIKQDSLNARLAKYTLSQSQWSQLPSLSVSGSYGRSLGRSINPATNQFVDAGYNFLSSSANSNVLLFGWMQVRNTIERNRYALQASLADLDQRKDDISLNVANGFLAALLSKEQVEISRNQVGLSKAQLDQTKAFAVAGRLPELNVAQLESQLAADSANLINAIASFNAALLDLKTLLNLDMSASFDVKAPEVEVKDGLATMTVTPEEVYNKAFQHFGAIKGNQLRVLAAQKGLSVAKSGLYPQLSASYQIGTTYASNFQTIDGYRIDTNFNGSFVDVNGGRFLVRQPTLIPNVIDAPFGNQLNNNFRQSIFLNLNVPIFNGWQSQYAIKQAKISLAQQQLSEYSTALTLKQNVYKAHNNALNAIQKYNAARRAREAAARALDFAKKRYELGLTSTVDFLVTQNSDFAAAANLVIAKYDLIFKLKVIDYYLGKELKL